MLVAVYLHAVLPQLQVDHLSAMAPIVSALAPRSSVSIRRCDPVPAHSAVSWRSCQSPSTPVAPSAPDTTFPVPPHVEPVRTSLLSQNLADHLCLQKALRQYFLQPGVFNLQCLEPFGVRHVHAAELASPQVVAPVRKAMPSARLLHRNARVRFLQKPNDLLFAESLLHVQSPSAQGLDSK